MVELASMTAAPETFVASVPSVRQMEPAVPGVQAGGVEPVDRPGTLIVAGPVEPVCVKVKVLAGFVPLPTTFCIVHPSVALAEPFQYVPLRLKMGDDCATTFVAAVMFAHVQFTALVWLKVVEKPAFANVRLAVAFVRLDHAEEHGMSPRVITLLATTQVAQSPLFFLTLVGETALMVSTPFPKKCQFLFVES